MSGPVNDSERKNKVMRRSISAQQAAGDRVNHGRREAQNAFQHQHAEFTNAAYQYEPQAREKGPKQRLILSTTQLRSDVVSVLRRVEQNTEQDVSSFSWKSDDH